MPKGISIEQFCSRNKVPYNIFYKWYKDTRNKIVEVKVESLLSYQDYSEDMTAEEQKRYINYLADVSNRQTWDYAPVMLCSRIFLMRKRF